MRTRLVRRNGYARSIVAIAVAGWSAEASGQASNPRPPSSLSPPTLALPALEPQASVGEPAPFPEASRPRAVARVEGTPAPGLQITLDAEASTGEGLRYRWVQTQGPPVALADPASRRARLTVPDGAGAIGFLLVVGNASGIDSTAVNVPVEDRSGRRPGLAADPGLVADAGDDQVGFVGRQITLNGSRSEPRGPIGYRWIPLGGPKLRLKLEDGYVFSFVPTTPGQYQFALVVASGGLISEPDVVSVSVGASPTSATAAGEPTALRMADAGSGLPDTIEAAARSALASLEGGPAVADDLADAFEAIGDRMSLYGSYAEGFAELAKRLDAIVPSDPNRRALWGARLFAPLTARMVESLRAEGLDLAQPGGATAPLAEGQRAKLAEQFRSMAEGFRATARRGGSSR